MRQEALDGRKKWLEKRTATKRADLLRAILDAESDGDLVTLAGIARAAKVSRSFIHAHPDLLERLRQAQQVQRFTHDHVERTLSTSRDGRMATAATLTRRLVQQREEIRALRLQLAVQEEARSRDLGRQLATMDVPGRMQLSDVLAQLERIKTENSELEAERRQTNALVRRLQEELTAVRRLLREATVGDADDGGLRALDLK
ncbi:hypothetical protein [Microbacterium algeriense]|uniref:hypothetical protein n=1 Tax=Microbacterium algeriense TaxID=2615184 RepID=UPI0003671C58|nr:hypothetical protein [Microbacterium barkeri]